MQSKKKKKKSVLNLLLSLGGHPWLGFGALEVCIEMGISLLKLAHESSCVDSMCLGISLLNFTLLELAYARLCMDSTCLGFSLYEFVMASMLLMRVCAWT